MGGAEGRGAGRAATRLRRSADVTAVLSARRQRAGSLAVVHARRRDNGEAPRIAVVASRKVGSAVRRNRAKRLLREAARRIPWQPAHDIVLVARAGCADANLDAVVDELASLAVDLRVTR